MRDLFTEIVENIRRNKLRTCLTGFAVAWGIFMLIVLLGAGNGVLNSFNMGSSTISVNTMRVRGGYTSKAYGGFERFRRIELDEGDVTLTAGPLFKENVDEVAPSVSVSSSIVNGSKYSSCTVLGCYPERAEMEKLQLLHGRFINSLDMKERRKTIVISEDMAQRLLVGTDDVSVLVGEYLKVGSLMFRVVGIIKTDMTTNDSYVYAPYSAVRTIWEPGDKIADLIFTFHGLETEEENEEFEEYYTSVINLRHGAAPDDSRALWIQNRVRQNIQMQQGGKIIQTFLWIVGILTLLGGIVGVSNIMLITVKERTHEFGIRKALGAKPWSVTKLVISESVCITALFGYIGMVLGLGVCEILDKVMGQSTASVLGEEFTIFVNPTVGLDVAIESTLLLIVAGTLAGLFPALKAAKVRPIEALREE